MALIAIECPQCGKATVFNGRGRCRCGAYLIHHMALGSRKYVAALDPPIYLVRSRDDWERIDPADGASNQVVTPPTSG